MRLVFAIIGAIIFSLYIVFDTQMMMGGNHKVGSTIQMTIYRHQICEAFCLL